MASSSSMDYSWVKHVTADEFLAEPETLRRRELIWGVVREPAAPFYSHQRVVTDIAAILQVHVRDRHLGEVVVSPIDVVLDREKGLVVQPDVVFLSPDNQKLVRNQIWGAPDLVVEVLSPRNQSYDKRRKLAWYRRYGVREYWIADSYSRGIIVHHFAEQRVRPVTFGMRHTLRSRVLPELRLKVEQIFV